MSCVGGFLVPIQLPHGVVRLEVLPEDLLQVLADRVVYSSITYNIECNSIIYIECNSICICSSIMYTLECIYSHTCHILPPSEIDLGLCLAVFAGSGGRYLFHRIG